MGDKKTGDYYKGLDAPFAETMCYSAKDLVSALNDVLDECAEQNVFGYNAYDDDEKKKEDDKDKDVLKVIIVGPLAGYYGRFVDKGVNKDLDGIKVELIK